LLGYRKYGHNEGDEPKFTQPLLYKSISKHKNPRDIYAAKLIAEGVIGENYVKQLEQEYKKNLEEDLMDSRKVLAERPRMPCSNLSIPLSILKSLMK
jgi:2-oxoglutarate dehydrogenase E1 component